MVMTYPTKLWKATALPKTMMLAVTVTAPFVFPITESESAGVLYQEKLGQVGCVRSKGVGKEEQGIEEAEVLL